MILSFKVTITNKQQGTTSRIKNNQQQQTTKMTTTQQIINEFTTLVDTEKEYTRNELGKMLTEVYRQITSDKPKKSDDKPKKKKSKKDKNSDEEVEPKKKREPTLYNLFVKEQMPLIKEEFPDYSRQDLMRKIGEIWRAKKEEKEEKEEEE